MATKASTFLLVLAVAVISASPAEPSYPPATPAPIDCNTVMTDKMISCLSFVAPGSNDTTPSMECCTGLASVIKDDTICICQIVSNPNNSQAEDLGADLKRAMLLPQACKISIPADKCAELGFPIATPVGVHSMSPAPASDGPAPYNPSDFGDLLMSPALATEPSGTSSSRPLVAILVPVLVGVALLIGLTWAWSWRNKKRKREIPRATISKSEHDNYDHNYNVDQSEKPLNNWDLPLKNPLDDWDLPLFEFNAVVVATDNFSNHNKLGQGGFGPVYKGRLEDGQDVAIKRLAPNSKQGVVEFKNEVMSIAKLQHRNFVKLLGCCIHEQERILIYEYMPNGSLDALLFGKEKGKRLDWNARYQIIVGIARGLLYLHEDSRVKIVHRDMKASNILMDKNMTPKISDFGLARIFKEDQEEANTMRLAGTFGYMPPEYVMGGIYSTKSDVFSFGVLVLEIVSGTMNRGGFHAQQHKNLLRYAWSLWRQGMTVELVDKTIVDSCSKDEVIKCITIGLLCVQEQPDDRPIMSSVMFMLGNDNAMVAQPKQPGFVVSQSPVESSTSSNMQESSSINHATITMYECR